MQKVSRIMTNYSQSNEQDVILNHFGDKVGRFLDIGAYDGRCMSNTYALVERGWKGVCVEASPQCFVALQKTHRNNDGVSLVCACMHERGGLLPFHDHGGATATLSDAHKRKWDSQVPYEDIHVACVTGNELVSALPGPYDFLSVDVEGADVGVLKSLPNLNSLGVEMFCVEVPDGKKSEIMDHSYSMGYELVDEFPLSANLIFAR